MPRNILAATLPAGAVVAALLAAGATPALAQEGHRPVYQRTDIVASGYYKLTRNVAGSGAPVITIAVGSDDRVVLDLNCFTIVQMSTNQPVIHVTSGGNIVIQNGETQNGTYGILAGPGSVRSVTVKGLDIRDPFFDGIHASGIDTITAQEVTVANAGDDGLDFDDVKELTVEDVLTMNAGDDGLEAFGAAAGASARVRRFTANDSGGDGMEIDNFTNALVIETFSRGAGRDGLHVSNTLGGSFTGFHMSGSGRHGVNVLSSQNLEFNEFKVELCTFSGFVADEFSDEIVAYWASLWSNGMTGMEIHSDRTTVERVRAIGNGQVGVHVTSTADGTVVRDSTGIGNVVWDLLAEGLNLFTFGNLFGTTGP